ncbi:Ultraviolet-B receptor UVR8 [Zancudomyces culisetae]|uniref:Ultraviolet-B receptor UVR8 n=1 Tax=Zancudomyces culisetae TaxID=1213189 RepID=A0A1R1PJ56_ZANCU|nr:Ultraviolet-B receptor UVR8 [Zancudomyces culisetae]|eukprot:OMH80959.1 Ultraviolet-B receptor UVR8 [Zancudomyces culisetae]
MNCEYIDTKWCVYSIGSNSGGQLGIGTTIDQQHPAHCHFSCSKHSNQTQQSGCVSDYTSTFADSSTSNLDNSSGSETRQHELDADQSAKVQFKVQVPKCMLEIANSCPPIIVGGGNHTLLYWMGLGILYGCGNNSDFELGITAHEDSNSNKTDPQIDHTTGFYAFCEVPLPRSTCSSTFCLGDASSGNPPDCFVPKSTCCIHQSIVKIKQIAAGWNHSLLLTVDGSVYSLGNNKYGQCGVLPESGNVVPKILGSSNNSGRGNTGTKNNTNFVQAWTKVSFALSVNTSAHLDSSCTDNANKLTSYDQNQHISAIGGQKEDVIKITKISAGLRHSMALSECGKVYGWGYNNHSMFDRWFSDPSPSLNPTYNPLLVRNTALPSNRPKDKGFNAFKSVDKKLVRTPQLIYASSCHGIPSETVANIRMNSSTNTQDYSKTPIDIACGRNYISILSILMPRHQNHNQANDGNNINLDPGVYSTSELNQNFTESCQSPHSTSVLHPHRYPLIFIVDILGKFKTGNGHGNIRDRNKLNNTGAVCKHTFSFASDILVNANNIDENLSSEHFASLLHKNIHTKNFVIDIPKVVSCWENLFIYGSRPVIPINLDKLDNFSCLDYSEIIYTCAYNSNNNKGDDDVLADIKPSTDTNNIGKSTGFNHQNNSFGKPHHNLYLYYLGVPQHSLAGDNNGSRALSNKEYPTFDGEMEDSSNKKSTSTSSVPFFNVPAESIISQPTGTENDTIPSDSNHHTHNTVSLQDVFLVCGSNHCALSTPRTLSAFCWGWNEHGNCGPIDSYNLMTSNNLITASETDANLVDKWPPETFSISSVGFPIYNSGCGYGNTFFVSVTD